MILKRNPDFKIFLDALNRSMTTLFVSNAITKEETVMRWNQGKAQELIDIINKIKNADEELRSFRPEARQHVE